MEFITITSYESLGETLRGCIVADSPIWVWGSPGIGKTHLIEQVAHDVGYGFFRLSAICRQPEEFVGYPRADGERVRLLLPEWAQDCDRPTVILLDDLGDANEYTQAAAYALADQRLIGIKKLPLRVVAAANPPDSNVFGALPPQGIRARFLHVLFKPTVESWATQIHKFEKDPKVADTLAVLAAYLNASYTPLSVVGQVGIACPRTWHSAARAICAGVDVRVALSSVIPEADVISQYVGMHFEILGDIMPIRKEILWFARLVRETGWIKNPPDWWNDVPAIDIGEADLPRLGVSG
jgi:hypothetical protein